MAGEPSSRSISYNALLTLSLEYNRPGLIDNIFTSAPFLAALYGAFGKKAKAKKGIRLIDGGERIKVNLMYGKNSTAKSYSGYETLDVTPQDGISAGFYDWKQLAVSIAISRREERQNAGPGKIKDLMEAKTLQAEMSLRDEINYQLLGKNVSSGAWYAGTSVGGSTYADLSPLGLFLPKDPTASVSVGNINQSTYSWWRPQVVDGSAAHGSKDSGAMRGFACTTWAILKAALRFTYNACGKGAGGFPDLVLTDQLGYESYEASLDDKTRYVNSGGTPASPATLGFDSVKLKGADMVWDEMMPDIDSGYVYSSASWGSSTFMFLNTQFIELIIDSATNFVNTPFVRPENQDARVAQILLMAEIVCAQRRKQGLLYGVTAGITS
jgi:hypothetical protein